MLPKKYRNLVPIFFFIGKWWNMLHNNIDIGKRLNIPHNDVDSHLSGKKHALIMIYSQGNETDQEKQIEHALEQYKSPKKIKCTS